ncbi:helix-hairpin-helix domain-containing protein [Halalkalibacter kiskunsagensis]|uniref:Helix-hairpin-helix domain-containing protein n=1 Tax=Halalkalibacter kiskunsagensis TaxID=1548599 RepID=A0ABV6KJD5_9BACI
MIKKIPEKKQIVISIGILLLVSLVLFVHFRNANEEEVNFDFQEAASLVQATETIPSVLIEGGTKITVDIKGAIALPGVYELNEGSRVHNVIEMAGGFLSDADELQLNLAQLLQDEMMIYVPTEGEEVQENLVNSSGNKDGKIAINRVDETTLEQLPGIGPAKAAAIISYREEHGPFKGIEDLQNVSGIGPKSAEKLTDYIVFN